MNNRIYRGKRLDNGEWVEGWLCKRLVHLDGCHQNVVVDAIEVYDGKNPLSIAHYTVDPDTVGQCSGMEDRNAKPIFEGDVVICSLIGGDIYHPPYSWNRKRVVYERGAFCVEDLSGDTAPLHDYAPGFEIEVIGNIHDNPELLKGGMAK